MKFSYGMLYENASDKNGFGYAGKCMTESLQRQGHEVNFLDSTAPVQIWWGQPQDWTWHPGQYRIGYLPWESTEFPENWVNLMNETDEIWTPSPIVAEWMVEAKVRVPIYVYQHGVQSVWRHSESLSADESPFRVFHHGAEAMRKGFTETLSCFRDVFYDQDATMTFKMMNLGWNMPVEGIKIIGDRLDLPDLVRLYQSQHLMLYPSWGEGFGLTPLQAMATGMPVLITKGWAPYEHLLPQECLIDSKLVDSPWPGAHPGKMFKPDYDDMVDKARLLHEMYAYQKVIASEIRTEVMLKYRWDYLTKRAFEHIVEDPKFK